MTIELIYRWRCPSCGRIFEMKDEAKLEEFRNLHLRSHEHEVAKWESKVKVEKHFQVEG